MTQVSLISREESAGAQGSFSCRPISYGDRLPTGDRGGALTSLYADIDSFRPYLHQGEHLPSCQGEHLLPSPLIWANPTKNAHSETPRMMLDQTPHILWSNWQRKPPHPLSEGKVQLYLLDEAVFIDNSHYFSTRKICLSYPTGYVLFLTTNAFWNRKAKNNEDNKYPPVYFLF